MYRVSPFTYIVSGMMSTGLANAEVRCSSIEYLNFNPPANSTCAEYLENYISAAGGYLRAGTEQNTQDCSFCVLSDTNAFLSQVNSNYADRWRNFGLIWPYIIFNIAGAIGLYWWTRVPKNVKVEKVEKDKVE